MESELFMAMINQLNQLVSDDSHVGVAMSEWIKDQLSKIETVTFPESAINRIYLLPNRRFNSEYLLNSPQS